MLNKIKGKKGKVILKLLKDSQKKQKGITLVALVITIVIIIILAMVTITFLFGEGGIVTKFQEAAKMSNVENTREKLEIATGTAIIEGKGETSIDEYWGIIEREGIIGDKDSDTEDNDDGTYDVVTNDGFIFQVMPIPDKDNANDILIEYVGDANGPRIKEIKGTTTTNSATIEVIAVNAENATYKYEYKKQGESDWITVEGQEESTCTIQGLEENEIYNIKVTVEVTSGANKGTATRETSVRTGEMPSGAITLENAIWQGDGTASVVVNSSEEGYNIQYQIIETGSITDQEEELANEEWQPIENGGNITGVEHNQTVYARLWDGNNGSSYASVDIKDEKVPQEATIGLSSTSVTTGTTVTATVTHNDNQSGPDITNCRYIWNSSSERLGTDASSYTEGSFSSNGQELSKVLSTKGTYYLHVLTVDKAGNAIETVSEGITGYVPNSVPTSLSVSYINKSTNSITINARASDADNDELTYTLYTATAQDGPYTQKAIESAEQNTQVSLTATGLNMYTTYYYYVTASDGKASPIESSNSNVRTYCSGTTLTCNTSSCSGRRWSSCSRCGGDGEITTLCSTCGGDGYCSGNLAGSPEPVEPSYDTYCNECGKKLYGGNKCFEITGNCATCGITILLDYYCSHWCALDALEISTHQCLKCNGTGSASATCSSCSGNGGRYINCTHGLSSSHRYCNHYNNTSVTSHGYCEHGETSMHD